MVDPREIIMHASDPAFLVGEGQRVLACNGAAEDLLGYPASEATALTCDRLVQASLPSGRAICTATCPAIRSFLSCRPHSAPDCQVRRKDGTQIDVAMSSVALPGNGKMQKTEEPIAIVFMRERTQPDTAESDPPTINTFGRFAVSVGGRRIALEEWPRKQAIQLLKFLSFHAGRPVHRDRLIDQLWPDVDSETGWARLKVTVHFLRQRFREAGLGDEIICTEEAAYVLRADRVRLDCLLFEEAARAGRSHQRAGRSADAIAAFRQAQSLYQGDYMEADLYADWCAEERERLIDIYIEVVNALAELNFIAGDFASAAQDCYTALVREPCRESAHRLLIESLIALNRPDRAIRQFERCRSVLAAELGVAPSPETAAVVASLAQRATPPVVRGGAV